MARTYDLHAQRVLHYTREEAAQRNEPHIRPDHLFIALVRDREGGAAQLLRELGIDRDKARYRVGPIRHPPPVPPGRPNWEPPGFTSKLRESLRWAEEEAERLGHLEVQSEHLLLGLMSVTISGGAGLLRMCGADPDTAWARAYERLGVPPEQRQSRPEPPPVKWPSALGPWLEELRRV
jgi:ATP-dependent Clp protease ATP-binding subunit ClpA